MSWHMRAMLSSNPALSVTGRLLYRHSRHLLAGNHGQGWGWGTEARRTSVRALDALAFCAPSWCVGVEWARLLLIPKPLVFLACQLNREVHTPGHRRLEAPPPSWLKLKVLFLHPHSFRFWPAGFDGLCGSGFLRKGRCREEFAPRRVPSPRTVHGLLAHREAHNWCDTGQQVQVLAWCGAD